MTYKKTVPPSCVRVIRALCEDYFRQKGELKKTSLPYHLQLSLYTYTEVIFDEVSRALRLAGAQAEEMIVDIGKNRGYRASALASLIGKGRYDRAKRRAIYGIAIRLFLIDEN